MTAANTREKPRVEVLAWLKDLWNWSGCDGVSAAVTFQDRVRRASSRPRLAALFGGVALLAAACGGGESTPDAAGEASGAQSSSSVALTGEFATLGGATIDLASLQGEDVVFWFWAPW